MKQYLLFVFMCVILSANAQQQAFSKVYYNGNQFNNVADFVRTDHNTCYLAGMGLLTKTDSLGAVVWSKRYGTPQDLTFQRIIQAGQNSLVLAGQMNGDAFIVSVDTNGYSQWATLLQFGQWSEVDGLSMNRDSGFVLCGYTHISIDTSKLVVARTDKQGNLLWSKAYLTDYFGNSSYAIHETQDSGFIVAAWVSNYVSAKNVLLKLDSLGNVQWCKGYSGGLCCSTPDLIVSGSDFIVALVLNQSLHVMKTNESGDIIWCKDQNTGTHSEYGLDPLHLAKLSTDRYVVSFPNHSWDANLIVCDTAGDQTMRNYARMYARSVTQASDGGLLILGNGPLSGYKNDTSNITENQFVLVKTTPAGENPCCFLDTPSSENDTSITTHSILVTVFDYYTWSDTNIVGNYYPFFFKDRCAGLATDIMDSESTRFSVYPNPSNGAFSLHFDNPLQHEECLIELYSPLGARVFSATETMREEIFLEVDNLNNGLYYLVVSSGSERVSRVVEVCQ